MRKIIAGQLKDDIDVVNSINKALVISKDILSAEGIEFHRDVLFYSQKNVDFEKGVEYSRNQSFIEIIISTNNVPNTSDIRSVILKSAIEQYVYNQRKDDFENAFLFDLYRTGIGLYFANKYGAGWSQDVYIDASWDSLLSDAKILIADESGYDKMEWFYGASDSPQYLIWYFGERIISRLLSIENLSIFEITENDVKSYLMRF